MKKLLLEKSQNRNQLMVGAVLVLVSSALGGAVLASETSQTKLLIAKTNLPTGTLIGESNFREVLVSGDGAIHGISEFPMDKALKSPMQQGEILQALDMVPVDSEHHVLALSLTTSSLPAGLIVGLDVDLWLVNGETKPRLIAQVEIVDVSKDEYADKSSISILAPSGLVSEIFEAGENLRVVIP